MGFELSSLFGGKNRPPRVPALDDEHEAPDESRDREILTHVTQNFAGREEGFTADECITLFAQIDPPLVIEEATIRGALSRLSHGPNKSIINVAGTFHVPQNSSALH